MLCHFPLYGQCYRWIQLSFTDINYWVHQSLVADSNIFHKRNYVMKFWLGCVAPGSDSPVMIVSRNQQSIMSQVTCMFISCQLCPVSSQGVKPGEIITLGRVCPQDDPYNSSHSICLVSCRELHWHIKLWKLPGNELCSPPCGCFHTSWNTNHLSRPD